MFQLSKKIGNKPWIIDSIDTLPIINRRKKALISSYRGQKVEFKVEPIETNEKYRKPLTDASWQGGDYDRTKYKTKAKIKAVKRKNR